MKAQTKFRKAISRGLSIGVIVILVLAAAVGVYYYSTTGTSTTSTTSQTTSSNYKNTIVIGTTDSVQTTLDPADAYDYFAGSEVMPNINDGLVDYRPGTSQYVPGLATSWSVTPDGMTWTFNLRQGVKFADGTQFNATVVNYSMDRQNAIQEAAGPFVGAGIGGTGAQCCGILNHTEVTGTYQIKFYLNHPFTAFLGMMAFSAMYPVEPKYAPMPAHPNPGSNEGVVNFTSSCNSEATCATENPNQLGAYMLTKWTRAGGADVEMDFTANPNYWNATGGYPKTPNIIVKFYADSTALALAMNSGEIDIAYRQLGATDVNAFKTNSAFHEWNGPGTFIQYLIFNEKDPAFTQTVRQAIAYAVNRTAIAKNVFQGQVNNLYSMIPVGMAYHTDAFKSAYGDANIAQAQTLLTQAGYSTSHKLIINLTYPTGHYTSLDLVSQQIKQALEKTGMVTVNVNSEPWSASYKPDVSGNKLQVYFFGWYPDYVDPYDYQYPFFPANGVGFLNTNWVNSTETSLLSQIASTSDTTTLASLYAHTQSIESEAVPIIPLFQGTGIAVSNTHVSGLVLDITQYFRYYLLQETA